MKVKCFLLFLIFTSLGTYLYAQSSDCATATSVCSSFFSQNDSPSGTGNVYEQAPGTCQTGGEFNSAWYVFTVQETGNLNFILTPNDLNNDYDWSLFDITTNGCAGINNGSSPEVSCNSYGENFGLQGATGISSAQGGFGNLNGPGNINGPPFNADLNVPVGEVFALVVMNFSATLDGYSLDFGSSLASVFDQVSPQIIGVTQNCNSNQLTVTFSESVLTNNLNSIPLKLDIDGQVYIPISITASNTNFSNQVILNFDVSLAPGLGTIGDSNTGAIEDFCGNILSDPFQTTIYAPLEIETVTIEPACNGIGGSISVDAITGGAIPYSIALNNQAQNGTLFENMEPGNYIITVTDANGCSTASSVTLDNQELSVFVGNDLVLCDMQTVLTATSSEGQFQWNETGGVSFSTITQPQTTVVATIPGQYEVSATLTLDNCITTDAIFVTFNFPPLVNISSFGVTCHDDCDGEVLVESANGEVLTASIGEQQETGSSILFESLCGGQMNLQVAFSAACLATYPVLIVEPAEIIAQFSADNYTVPVSSPTILLSNSSINADSIAWELVGYESVYFWSENNWELVLPEIAGVYQIRLIAFADSVCSDDALTSIIVTDDFQFYLPNAFTPNNDGINDYFIPIFSAEPKKYEFLIFDRWGNVIFRTSDPTKPWTGEVIDGDHYAQDNIYHWLLKVQANDIGLDSYNGSVAILR